MKKIFLSCLVVLFSSITLSAQNDKSDIVKVGDTMPEFILNSSINGTVKSTDLKDKVILINIFATWCGPCQKELAEVKETLWPMFKDNQNFRMLTVGREHTDKELIEYNKRKGFAFPLYPDPKREFTSKFATSFIPRCYVINKEGIVIAANVGLGKMDEMIKIIKEALK